jgi:twitching motility protein PilU
MRTFDWALFELYNDGHISYEEAIRNADSANELRLAIKLKSARGEPANASGLTLTLDNEPGGEELEAQRADELAKQQDRKRDHEQARLAQLHEERKAALQKKREQEDLELAALRAQNRSRETQAA